MLGSYLRGCGGSVLFAPARATGVVLMSSVNHGYLRGCGGSVLFASASARGVVLMTSVNHGFLVLKIEA